MAEKSKAGITGQVKSPSFLIGISALIVVLVLAVSIFVFDQTTGPAWSLDGSGALSFPPRGAANPQAYMIEDAANYSLEKISYSSYDTKVFGLLRIPKGVTLPPVVIVLPAATVTKEADSAMAGALCSWGYASLTLDERGNGGETRGSHPMDFMTGYTAYRNGDMPAQYAQVYDVLLGYDYLRSRKDLDGGNITVLGESMGGRFAVVAAGIEPGFKAVFVISSSPYGLDAGNDRDALRFVNSIEPATYLKKLPPRKLVMFHFTNDTVIPVTHGKFLYDNAGWPKAWYQYNGSVHGVYSDIFGPDLHTELTNIYGR